MDLNFTYGRGGFEGKQNIDTTNVGPFEAVFLPSDAKVMTVQLHVDSTAVVTIEATASIRADVVAGTAYWSEWSKGAITNGDTGQDCPIGPFSAVRANIKTAKAGVNAHLAIQAQRSNP